MRVDRRHLGRATAVAALVALGAFGIGIVGGSAVQTGQPGAAAILRGFDNPEFDHGRQARWTLSDPALFTVTAAGDLRDASLIIELSSYSQPRQVTFTFRDRPLYTTTVGTQPRRVSVPLGDIPPGQWEVAMTTRPGLEPVAPPGSEDTRRVSLRLVDDVRLESADR